MYHGFISISKAAWRGESELIAGLAGSRGGGGGTDRSKTVSSPLRRLRCVTLPLCVSLRTEPLLNGWGSPCLARRHGSRCSLSPCPLPLPPRRPWASPRRPGPGLRLALARLLPRSLAPSLALHRCHRRTSSSKEAHSPGHWTRLVCTVHGAALM